MTAKKAAPKAAPKTKAAPKAADAELIATCHALEAQPGLTDDERSRVRSIRKRSEPGFREAHEQRCADLLASGAPPTKEDHAFLDRLVVREANAAE